MKILKYILATIVTFFGGRAQATPIHSENPLAQSQSRAEPMFPLAIEVGDDIDEDPDKYGVPVIMAPTPAPIPHRLHEAVVTKWNEGQPAKANFVSKNGNVCSATVVEQVGNLLRLKRGNCGTFIRSAV